MERRHQDNQAEMPYTVKIVVHEETANKRQDAPVVLRSFGRADAVVVPTNQRLQTMEHKADISVG